ncbi:MAG: cupredoxin domain-containing protein [Nitrospinae bacterium]|nr:cupredoxin domain-containing protein [Nitrospinota bacterium]
MSYSNLLLLGAIAGFTIFLGLPVAMLTTRPKFRAFMTALSAGVLIFLLVEISNKSFEIVEEAVKSYFVGQSGPAPTALCLIFFLGFTAGMFGLTFFEEKFVGTAKDSPEKNSSKSLSMMIAIGIGLHNFGEGLAIGQEYVSGAISLAYLLIAGFALHNATEGFGIAAPLRMEKVDWKFLGLAGLVGGGPTFVGVLVGSVYYSRQLELLALSLAAGSILYVVGELLHLGKVHGHHRTVMVGLLTGFFISFASDAFIEVGTAVTANKKVPSKIYQVEASEFKFTPSHFEAVQGETLRFEITNKGTENHEFEMPDLKTEVVLTPGANAVVTVPDLKVGEYLIRCDLPGHLEHGMKGELVVKPKI